jgi:predicted O-methyltransferase YrrM
MKVGVFPVIDHYYEPMFNPKYLRYSLKEDRPLPGIQLNVAEQLDILSKFHFNNELMSFPLEKTKNGIGFYYHNGKFGSGDAEYYYNMIRLYKPKRIVEIGAGYSTLMAINAITANKRRNRDYTCELTCIEPYERPWLEQLQVRLMRERVEKVDKVLFSQLSRNDILYIDSSHIIRPQGDVLFECLEVLPILKSGVIIHIHDVFTPGDYPDWDFVHFFNEQYLVEAFLSCNTDFKIIGALNFLQRHYFSELASKCPILKSEPHKVAGSFWIIKM